MASTAAVIVPIIITITHRTVHLPGCTFTTTEGE
jgi:hypothetical protein